MLVTKTWTTYMAENHHLKRKNTQTETKMVEVAEKVICNASNGWLSFLNMNFRIFIKFYLFVFHNRFIFFARIIRFNIPIKHTMNRYNVALKRSVEALALQLHAWRYSPSSVLRCALQLCELLWLMRYVLVDWW